MSDRASAAGIVASNAVALALALWQQWPILLLLITYWLQSVIIGWYSGRRILALRQFSLKGTSGFTGANDEEIKRNAVKFFAMHYGAFHLAYLAVLVASYSSQKFSGLDALCIAVAGVAFAFAHQASFRRNTESDARGRPNIALVMFLPYIRILPMHLVMLLGLAFAGKSPLAALFFGVLKTAADVAMHLLEHQLRSRAA